MRLTVREWDRRLRRMKKLGVGRFRKGLRNLRCSNPNCYCCHPCSVYNRREELAERSFREQLREAGE